MRTALADAYARVRDHSQELTRQALAPHGVDVPPNLTAITSVTLAVIGGLMIQWVPDPTATPNAEEVVDALAVLGVIAAR